MRELLKKLFSELLKIFSFVYLNINRIEVIAITGSAGKTTAKAAIGALLKDKNDLYIPEVNYNTEIGVPLVIFQEKTPDNINNASSWLRITLRIFAKLFKKAPYKEIVLELGADKPGDIKHLVSFVKPKIAIVTSVLPVHTEEFITIENIAKEKGYVVEALSKNGTAILNIDDRLVRMMGNRTRAKIFWVGEDKTANVHWENLVFKPNGLSFDLYARGQKYKVKTKIIAPQLLISLLSAFCVGLLLNVEIRDLIDRMQEFKPKKGRMRVYKGINHSTIIDDTYNANPKSTIAALEVLAKMPGRKIAVLGSMLELGPLEKEGHIEVGRKAREVANVVVTVGKTANKYLANEANKSKKAIVEKFENSKLAGEYLKSIIEDEDVILAKGSQGVYMEEAVKAILADPKDAVELVRQKKMWEDKKAKVEENHD